MHASHFSLLWTGIAVCKRPIESVFVVVKRFVRIDVIGVASSDASLYQRLLGSALLVA